jgi:hypothetical protein
MTSIFASVVLVSLSASASASASSDTSSGTKTGEVQLAAPSQSYDRPRCKEWSIEKKWGAAEGIACSYPSYVEGWVEDRKDDHHCVVVKVKWYKHGHKVHEYESPEVCGKGHHERFKGETHEYADEVKIELEKE